MCRQFHFCCMQCFFILSWEKVYFFFFSKLFTPLRSLSLQLLPALHLLYVPTPPSPRLPLILYNNIRRVNRRERRLIRHCCHNSQDNIRPRLPFLAFIQIILNKPADAGPCCRCDKTEKEYVMKGRTERTTPASEKMFLIVISEKVLRVAQFIQRTN